MKVAAQRGKRGSIRLGLPGPVSQASPRVPAVRGQKAQSQQRPRPPHGRNSQVCVFPRLGGPSSGCLHRRKARPRQRPAFCPQREPCSQTREDQELGRGRVSEGLSLPHGSQAREGGPHPNSQSWLRNEQWLQAQEGQRGRWPEALLWLSHEPRSVSGPDPCLVRTQRTLVGFYEGTIYVQENPPCFTDSSGGPDTRVPSWSHGRDQEGTHLVTRPAALCPSAVSPGPRPGHQQWPFPGLWLGRVRGTRQRVVFGASAALWGSPRRWAFVGAAPPLKGAGLSPVFA